MANKLTDGREFNEPVLQNVSKCINTCQYVYIYTCMSKRHPVMCQNLALGYVAMFLVCCLGCPSASIKAMVLSGLALELGAGRLSSAEMLKPQACTDMDGIEKSWNGLSGSNEV